MNRIFYFVLLIISVSFISCSPKIATNIGHVHNSFNDNEEVAVLSLSDSYPDSYDEVGVVKIYDSGFSANCKYDRVIELAKMEARKAGGNVLKITEHEKPSFTGSSCDQIVAKILKVNDIYAMQFSDKVETRDVSNEYATLYVYRRKSGNGSLIGYPIFYGDSALCYVKNGLKRKFRLYDVSPQLIWAKTEARKDIPVLLEKGKEYYVRCGINLGFFVGQPNIALVDNVTGRSEYESIVGDLRSSDLIVLKTGEKIECNIVNESIDQIVITRIDTKETKTYNKDLIKDIVYKD